MASLDVIWKMVMVTLVLNAITLLIVLVCCGIIEDDLKELKIRFNDNLRKVIIGAERRIESEIYGVNDTVRDALYQIGKEAGEDEQGS